MLIAWSASYEQIWDLRTGGIFETIKYDHGVTALQFDTRKIVAGTGENGVKVRISSLLASSSAVSLPIYLSSHLHLN